MSSVNTHHTDSKTHKDKSYEEMFLPLISQIATPASVIVLT